MTKPTFTPEELAEMAAFDAMVDAEPIDDEMLAAGKEIETHARMEGMDWARREVAEYQRRYREAHKDEAAEYQRRYRERKRRERADANAKKGS